MELWTGVEGSGWRRWSDVGHGLDALTGSARTRILLVAGGDPRQDEQLLSVLRLVRRFAGSAAWVIAGSEHPTAGWVAEAREAGADEVVLVPKGPQDEGTSRLEHSVALGEGLCPALHVLPGRDLTLSVCGRHHDRMVLARHHLDRWCLAGKDDCPHWQGGYRG